MRLTDLEITLTPTEETVLWALYAIGGGVELRDLLPRCGNTGEAYLAIDFLHLAKRLGLVGFRPGNTTEVIGLPNSNFVVRWAAGPIVLTPRGEHVAVQIAARVEREAAGLTA